MTLQHVNGERLWGSLMEIGRIGETPGGGSRRLALTAEDGQARELFCEWAREAGLAVMIDRIGNIFVRREGTDPEAPPVVFGSHLDTVPTGGKFDGPLGVLAGLELLRRVQEQEIRTRAPLELVNWTNEEGSRFSPMTLGSSVFVGDVALDFALSREDAAGIAVADALAKLYSDTELAPVGGRKFAAYLEIHVEQGPLLKEGGQAIGIVTGSYTALYFVATVRGEAAHVGPTLMEQRRDAMAGAAALTLEIERIGRSRGRQGRSNAPHVEVFPNVRGVIPAEVRLSCDVRHADPDEARAMAGDLREACNRIARERGLEIALEQYFEFGPVECDAAMASLVLDQASALGLACRDLLTVASHDAVPMMRHCPSALFFIPSETGISHNEAEYSTPEQCRHGADVLLNAVLQLAR
jgi:beta-ureidopropionase / N-carbamoyl-L-amino-acid hydrolase